MIASKPCLRHCGMAATNSRVLRSASHLPVSGYAHCDAVSEFKSSNVACTIRELSSKPSILCPFQVRPA